jgi:hypothetical protein
MGLSKPDQSSWSSCDNCGRIEHTASIYARKAWTLKGNTLLCPMCNGRAPKSTVKIDTSATVLGMENEVVGG